MNNIRKNLMRLIWIYNNNMQEEYGVSEYDLIESIIESDVYVNEKSISLKKKINDIIDIYDNNQQEEEDITEYDLVDLLVEISEELI